MRRTGWTVAALLASVSLLACVGPARTESAYRDKGQTSAASALSAVRNAQLVAEVVQRDGLFWPQVSIVLSDAADESAYTEQTFWSIQPPDPSLDAYRGQLLDELTRAADVIATMRIAARRTDAETVISEAERLPDIAASLERLAGPQA